MIKKVSFLRLLIITLILIFITIMAVITFYSIPYVKCNNLIISANKNKSNFSSLDAENEEVFISKDDYDKLIIVPADEINDNRYIKIKSNKKLSLDSVNSLELKCHIVAKVFDYDTFEELNEYTDDILITFVFKDFKWKVINVDNANSI